MKREMWANEISDTSALIGGAISEVSDEEKDTLDLIEALQFGRVEEVEVDPFLDTLE